MFRFASALERHKHRCSLFGRVVQAEQGLKQPGDAEQYLQCHCILCNSIAAFPLQCFAYVPTYDLYSWRQVKTAVVCVPCGIEGSMVNEFVEALDSQVQEDATGCEEYR